MNEPDVRRNRILVALDASPLGNDALEAAGEMAAHLGAELAGLFIEDVNLLRLAGLPFAQEICSSSALLRPLDLPSMERTLRALADQVRQALAATAQHAQVRWSFEIRRGPVVRMTLAAAEDADLLVIGRRSLSPPVKRRATAKRGPPRPILVLFDGTPAAERALLIAIHLGHERATETIVLLLPDETRAVASLRAAALEFTRSLVSRVTIAPDRVTHALQLLAAARTRQCSLVLLNRDSRLLDETTIDGLVNDLDCPLGLVR